MSRVLLPLQSTRLDQNEMADTVRSARATLNLLQMDPFAKNSLNRLPTEIKEIVVTMVARQDAAYRDQRTIMSNDSGLLQGDYSQRDFGYSKDEEGLVGEEYAALDDDETVPDERRRWRRLLGKGISSVFRVNREFSTLAAPHLFTVCRINNGSFSR